MVQNNVINSRQYLTERKILQFKHIKVMNIPLMTEILSTAK